MAANFVFDFSVPRSPWLTRAAATGNVSLATTNSSGFSVLNNDLGPGITITASDTSQRPRRDGGREPPTGTFSYNPPVGYEGTDTFTYTITNAAGSDVGTVTMTVSGMLLVHQQQRARACTTIAAGCGRLTNPFSTLPAFEAVNGGATTNGGDVVDPEAGDIIFIYTGSGPYIGPAHAGEQPASNRPGREHAPWSRSPGITPGGRQRTLPSTGGTAPTIQTGSNAFTLAANNRLHGMAITGSTGIGIAGTNFGTATITENMSISMTGAAGIPITLNTGTVTASFTSISTGTPTARPPASRSRVSGAASRSWRGRFRRRRRRAC